LATSATLFIFSIFKWVAAAYLFYLGIKAWRSKVRIGSIEVGSIEKGKIFKESLMVTTLNPKGIIFFIAFFPLFMNANKPALSQMLIMAISFYLYQLLVRLFILFFQVIYAVKLSRKNFNLFLIKLMEPC